MMMEIQDTSCATNFLSQHCLQHTQLQVSLNYLFIYKIHRITGTAGLDPVEQSNTLKQVTIIATTVLISYISLYYLVDERGESKKECEIAWCMR